MNALGEIIRDELRQRGPCSFARFMELALYAPGLGYYERAGGPGRAGDFYTSVSVGSLFGELLAYQLADWLKELNEAAGGSRRMEGPLQLVEAGAHDGQLAADILNFWHAQRPEVFGSVEYWIVEPSSARRAWQEKKLSEFAGQVRWFGDGCELPKSGVRGAIFANELLDAMPVHRLGWDARARRWFEWGVDWNGKGFGWVRLPLNEEGMRLKGELERCFEIPPALKDILPEDFTVEICPAASEWWRQAAGALQRGKLLTFDYGLRREEFFQPERQNGTLRAYRQQLPSTDVLADPGEQDLTAHVNFSAIQAVGEQAGLRTEALISQEQFLGQIGRRALPDESFGPWTPARVRQFQTLTHPEHLGRSFRALLQAR